MVELLAALAGCGRPRGASTPRGTRGSTGAARAISSSNSGSPMWRALSARNLATSSARAALPVGEQLAPRRVHERLPDVVARRRGAPRPKSPSTRSRHRSRPGSPSGGRACRPGSARGSRSAGAASARPARPAPCTAAPARRGRAGSGARARRASAAARAASASSTSSEARTSRPCSSHVYQVVPTPASSATSSRRRPGVRRRPPLGSPTSSGWRLARRVRRKSASSARRRSPLISRGRAPVAVVWVLSTTRINPSLVPG